MAFATTIVVYQQADQVAGTIYADPASLFLPGITSTTSTADACQAQIDYVDNRDDD
jgi:hypothetical protein